MEALILTQPWTNFNIITIFTIKIYKDKKLTWNEKVNPNCSKQLHPISDIVNKLSIETSLHASMYSTIMTPVSVDLLN